MEKTLEKSQEQAEIIKSIALQIAVLDLEYCKAIAADMLMQATKQQTLMILNPSHSNAKNELLRKQAQALQYLVQYVESLKEADEIKEQIRKEEVRRAAIDKLFI